MEDLACAKQEQALRIVFGTEMQYGFWESSEIKCTAQLPWIDHLIGIYQWTKMSAIDLETRYDIHPCIPRSGIQWKLHWKDRISTKQADMFDNHKQVSRN